MFEAHKIDKINFNFNFNYNGFNKAKKFVQTNIVSKKYGSYGLLTIQSLHLMLLQLYTIALIPMTMHWTFQINYVWEKWKRKKRKDSFL